MNDIKVYIDYAKLKHSSDDLKKNQKIRAKVQIEPVKDGLNSSGE